ncbi:unnamed protein product [Rangifer tarandus platyrhynchus]|uniref:Uncharacterized protein n=2 Tax=Rangifer tarandus platyrhynchus TaxID=3082113 RepID=A0ABN8ZXE4_RANTA|nr:unnamed protein product [Rangifer tarandus platyrhynchus]CAI9712376.1 unnamed protein product [Rangifer tarandus platyrhynchus]
MQAGENKRSDGRKAQINPAPPSAPAAGAPRLRSGSESAGPGAPPDPAGRGRGGSAHLGGKEPREVPRKPRCPDGEAHCGPASRTPPPPPARVFLFGDRSAPGQAAAQVRRRGWGGHKLAGRSRRWRGRRRQGRPPRAVPAAARPRPLAPRSHPAPAPPRLGARGRWGARTRRLKPPHGCSGRPSGRLARTKRSGGAGWGGGGEARASERAAHPARLAGEVLAARTARPGGRAGEEARSPSGPPRDAHAGTRAPQPRSPAGEAAAPSAGPGAAVRAPSRSGSAPPRPPDVPAPPGAGGSEEWGLLFSPEDNFQYELQQELGPSTRNVEGTGTPDAGGAPS